MKLVLLGDPVAHSRSPAIHQAAFEHLGIEGSYVARNADAAGLARAIAEIKSGHLDGANVTMPLKSVAAAAADALAGDAGRARAVNTLVRDDDRVVGHLTDIAGVRTGWETGKLPTDGPVLVLGTGGAAAAALLALEGRRLLVSGRRPPAIDILAGRLAMDIEPVEWGLPVPGAVVVNATPIGMRGEALPTGVVEAATGYFEMTYGDAPTRATLLARSLGIPEVGGIEMLVGQAAAAFSLWTGLTPPHSVMRAAAQATYS